MIARSCLPRRGESIHPGRMKPLHCLAACLFFASFSCEQHDWEDTKALHETHGHEDHGDHGDGHDDHGGEDAGHGGDH